MVNKVLTKEALETIILTSYPGATNFNWNDHTVVFDCSEEPLIREQENISITPEQIGMASLIRDLKLENMYLKGQVMSSEKAFNTLIGGKYAR